MEENQNINNPNGKNIENSVSADIKKQSPESLDAKNESKTPKLGNILNKISKTILSLIYAILGIIVIILIYNIIQISIMGKPYMDIFGYSIFQVKTGSMSGTIEIGDIIVVELTKDVEKNDIITYEKEQILITHRIIEKQGESITTKGDANSGIDEPITTDEVIGKVVYTLRNVEIWKKVFKTPEVYTLVIITIILFGITISIGEKRKE